MSLIKVLLGALALLCVTYVLASAPGEPISFNIEGSDCDVVGGGCKLSFSDSVTEETLDFTFAPSFFTINGTQYGLSAKIADFAFRETGELYYHAAGPLFRSGASVSYNFSHINVTLWMHAQENFTRVAPNGESVTPLAGEAYLYYELDSTNFPAGKPVILTGAFVGSSVVGNTEYKLAVIGNNTALLVDTVTTAYIPYGTMLYFEQSFPNPSGKIALWTKISLVAGTDAATASTTEAAAATFAAASTEAAAASSSSTAVAAASTSAAAVAAASTSAAAVAAATSSTSAVAAASSSTSAVVASSTSAVVAASSSTSAVVASSTSAVVAASSSAVASTVAATNAAVAASAAASATTDAVSTAAAGTLVWSAAVGVAFVLLALAL